MEDQLHFEETGLTLNDTAQFYLRNTARWAKFLAIIGFVTCGLLVLLGVGFSTFFAAISSASGSEAFSAFNPAIFGFIYVILGLFYFMPSLFLYQFAVNGVKAIDEQDSELLAKAIDKHHSMYKFVGICTAIIFGLYAVIIVFALLIGGGAALFS